MKSTFSLPVLMMLLFTIFATTVNATDYPANSLNLNGLSNTWLGNYQIKELSPVSLNGATMRTFELTYEKAGNPVMIYIDERANCREYIVRSKNLEVKYVCNKSSFGAKLVTGKFRKYDPMVNSYFLAYEELVKQEKIAEGGMEISSALGLIASYYPGLFKRPDLLD